MRARLRAASDIAASMAILGALVLGVIWLMDRAHRWETPVWPHREFVRLRSRAIMGDPTGPTWVIPVNPRCPHCMRTLAGVHAAWIHHRPAALVALIVDTRHAPGARALAGFPPIDVWWDRANVWRRRWGHRLYGERIEFDVGGHLIQSVAAHDGWWNAPTAGPAHPAPADRSEGGTGP